MNAASATTPKTKRSDSEHERHAAVAEVVRLRTQHVTLSVGLVLKFPRAKLGLKTLRGRSDWQIVAFLQIVAAPLGVSIGVTP